MNARVGTFYFCIAVMIGASGLVANSVYPNNSSVLIGVVALVASMSVFIALLFDAATVNVVNAVAGKDREEQVSLLSAVIGKSLVKVLKDENGEK
jgi:hypothetical protein